MPGQRQTHIAWVGWIVVVGGCAQTSHPPARQPSPAESAPDAGSGLPERVDGYFARYAKVGDFAGVALMARGDRTLFEKAYGKADVSSGADNTPNTRFRVASVSKTFTGAAVAMLASAGKLSLDDRVAKYLPTFPRADVITLRHLLLHRSGVGQVTDADVATTCLGTDEILQRIARAPRLFEPGTSSSYSNEGFFILAVVVEKAVGEPFGAFLEKNVFRPLHMASSGTLCSSERPPGLSRGHIPSIRGVSRIAIEEAAMIGAGSVYSTARDLLAWMQSLRRGDLLTLSSLEYPYGWGKRNYGGHPLIEQTGTLSGFAAHIALYGDDETYAIVLSNVQSGMVQRLATDLHSLLFGDGVVSTPPDPRSIDISATKLASFEGDYSSEHIPVPLRVRVESGQLTSRWGDNPFRMIWLPVGEDEFFTRQEYARAHLERDSSGVVTGATVAWPQGAPLSFLRHKN